MNQQPADDTNRTRTYRSFLQEHRLVAIGQQCYRIDAFVEDMTALRRVWAGNMGDGGYPAFAAAWSSAHFSLVHLGTPPVFGRREWFHALCAAVMGGRLRDMSINPHSVPPQVYWVMVMEAAYTLYFLLTVWATQPPHLGPRIEIPVTPAILARLAGMARTTVVASAQVRVLPGLGDAAIALQTMVTSGAFSVHAWLGGGNNSDTLADPALSWQTLVPQSPMEFAVLNGAFGRECMRTLRTMPHHANPQQAVAVSETPSALGKRSTRTRPPSSAAAVASEPPVETTAHVRAALDAMTSATVVPAGYLERIDERATAYERARQPLVDMGLVPPPPPPLPPPPPPLPSQPLQHKNGADVSTEHPSLLSPVAAATPPTIAPARVRDEMPPPSPPPPPPALSAQQQHHLAALTAPRLSGATRRVLSTVDEFYRNRSRLLATTATRVIAALPDGIAPAPAAPMADLERMERSLGSRRRGTRAALSGAAADQESTPPDSRPGSAGEEQDDDIWGDEGDSGAHKRSASGPAAFRLSRPRRPVPVKANRPGRPFQYKRIMEQQQQQQQEQQLQGGEDDQEDDDEYMELDSEDEEQ